MFRSPSCSASVSQPEFAPVLFAAEEDVAVPTDSDDVPEEPDVEADDDAVATEETLLAPDDDLDPPHAARLSARTAARPVAKYFLFMIPSPLFTP